MYKIHVKLEGIVPILFNPMTQEIQEAIPGSTGEKHTAEWYREQAWKKVYLCENGDIGIPAQSIKKCIRQGAVKESLKYGRKGLEPFLEAVMFIEPNVVSFGKKKADFIDERSGRIPPGPRGKRVMLYRPCVQAPWFLEFSILVMDDRIPIESVKIATQQAGILCGLADYRPEFGRFTVIKWEVERAKTGTNGK